ncbi:unnamed protein product [Sphagnum jensenii]|uniref:Peptidase A1 domain-containing protein n=1 Tax=Sphagnum jensenii TaxID=128206 RepID=A0ABP0VTM5_9BRYO
MALELFDMGTLLDLCNYSNSSIEIPSVNFNFPNAAVLETTGGAFSVFNENNAFAGFCLGIRNSSLPDIRIGFLLLSWHAVSSMFDYSFTFNQQDKLLGWIPSTCYNDITTSAAAPAPIFAPVSTPTSSTPPAPTPPSSAPPAPTPPSPAPTSPSPPSLSPLLSPSTGPPTAPSRSASVMEFVLPSPIIALPLLGFLLYLSLL